MVNNYFNLGLFLNGKVGQQLSDFARLENFWFNFNTIFGTQYNSSLAEAIRSQWESGDFSQLPLIKVINGQILKSARGAYASETNVIYLSDTFLGTASANDVSAVLFEEIGHWVDAQVNQHDTTGDEGELFSALVRNEDLDSGIINLIRLEDDSSTIFIDNQLLKVEQSTPRSVYNIIIEGAANDNYFRRSGQLYIFPTVALPETQNGVNPVDLFISSGSPIGSPQTGAIRLGTNTEFLDRRTPIDLAYVTTNSNQITIVPDYRLASLGVNVFSSFSGVTAGLWQVYDGSINLMFQDQRVSGTIDVLAKGEYYYFNSPYRANISGVLSNGTPFGSNRNDFNGDGSNDLVIQGAGFAGIWSMNNTSVTSWAGLPSTNGGKIVGVGDFNGDGKNDLVIQGAGFAGIWSMNNTSVASWAGLPSTNGGKIVGVGDFNGDGKNDLVIQGSGFAGIWSMNNTSVTSWAGLPSTSGGDIVGVGDFNGDGKNDLVIQGAGFAGIWSMNNTSVTSWTGLPSTSGGKIVGVGDFNGDGKNDLVIQGADFAGIWSMNNTSVTSWAGLPSTSGGNIVGVGDFNGDGKNDLVIQGAGFAGIWSMNNTSVTSWSGLPSTNGGNIFV